MKLRVNLWLQILGKRKLTVVMIISILYISSKIPIDQVSKTRTKMTSMITMTRMMMKTKMRIKINKRTMKRMMITKTKTYISIMILVPRKVEIIELVIKNSKRKKKKTLID